MHTQIQGSLKSETNLNPTILTRLITFPTKTLKRNMDKSERSMGEERESGLMKVCI